MSIKVMTKVWEWSKSEGASLLVMLALADHADDDGYCCPGIARIARKCRISERSVQRHIKDCEQAGELAVAIGAGMTVFGGSTNRYRITVNNGGQPRTEPGDKLTPGDKSGAKVVTNTEKGGDTALAPESSVEPSDKPSEPPKAPSLPSVVSVALRAEQVVRLGDLFGRMGKTSWSQTEIAKLKQVNPSIEEMDLIEPYYAAERAKPRGIQRRDLKTLLNNWQGEVDRAKQFAAKQKPSNENDQAF